ncbi:MAG: hypothetical protein OZ948_08215 [Deltaproteobacteria bacterium]|nr:hypothetical protein [Deltaproteobacteria bacterium]
MGAAVPSPAIAQLTEAEIFLELNDTDGDLGLHVAIDGAPYTRLRIEDPKERLILALRGDGGLLRQGLTQLFLESAEPSFDELSPGRFFRRFPEGPYEIEVIRGRRELEATAELSHVLAAPPSAVTVSGLPAAEDCDAVPLPRVREPVVIGWEPVTGPHPEIGRSGPVEIERYQLFVEQGDVKFAVDLPPSRTEFEVPAEILATRGVFKFEIIARTTERNNTAIESCFVLQ